jgi:hypothetical protein
MSRRRLWRSSTSSIASPATSAILWDPQRRRGDLAAGTQEHHQHRPGQSDQVADATRREDEEEPRDGDVQDDRYDSIGQVVGDADCAEGKLVEHHRQHEQVLPLTGVEQDASK